MSRGLGPVQRCVLTVLARRRADYPDEPWRHWCATVDLARQLHGESASRSQLEATRRALLTLERRGLVELGRRRSSSEWTRRMRAARLRLSDEEREAEEVERSRWKLLAVSVGEATSVVSYRTDPAALTPDRSEKS